MAFREREIDFREADHHYAELRRQLDAGTISTEEFDAERRRLMVQDDEGRWWAKSGKTGEWNYHDGNAWVRDTPPAYQPPPTLPEESTPDLRSQHEQEGERLPSSQTDLTGSAPVRDQNEGKQRRGVLRGVIIVAGVVVLAALAGIGTMTTMAGEGPPPGEEVSAGPAPGEEASAGPAPGYALLRPDSGGFSVEIPSDWDERVVVDSEGEKGRNWSSLLSDGESAGPSMTAVNDLTFWRDGTRGHQGIYIVASKKLAQEYTDDELVTSGPNDYSSNCEAGTPQDFERPPYSGRMLEWNNCGGDSDHVAIALAAAPEDRECVVVFQIGGLPRVEEESVQHILDTFETDCDKTD